MIIKKLKERIKIFLNKHEKEKTTIKKTKRLV